MSGPLKTLLFCFVILIHSFSGTAQIRIKNGTTVTMLPNTLVTVQGVTKSLTLEAGAVLVNNGVIEVGDSTTIVEPPGFPITGTGKEVTSRNYPMPLLDENIAGFGAEVTTSIAPGPLTVTRTHENFFDSLMNPGIKRAFQFLTPTNSLNATIKFRYDTTELNGLGEPDLTIHESFDNGLTWEGVTGTAFPASNYVGATSIDSLGFYTVFMRNITSTGISADHCEAEQFQVYVNAPGGLSSSNTFVVQLSDVNGSFASPATIGSQQTNLSGNISATIPNGIIAGSNYRIRVVSTDAALFGVPSQPFQVTNLPGIPATPAGPAQICNDGTLVYFTAGATNADSYNWHLTPANAGTILSSADSVVIMWDTTFTGNAVIEVTGVNICGEGVASSLTISVNECVGISDNKNRSIRLAPNPAVDHVTLSGLKGYDRYTIHTLDGKVACEGDVQGEEQKINLQQLASGVYYISITGPGKFHSAKFLIR